MVKFADSGALIWLIIFVMVSLAKGWSKLQESKESQSPQSDDAPPPVRPRTAVRRPPPRPLAPPMPRVPRAVPPAMRRPAPQPSPISKPSGRKVSADDIRHVVERMSRKPQPLATAPLPLPPPPVAKAETFPPPPPAPPPAPSPSLQEAPASTPPPANAPPPPPSSRASQWMEALRDRQNIRNIIVAYEIIGPPRSELV
jgi:hypothetical protein